MMVRRERRRGFLLVLVMAIMLFLVGVFAMLTHITIAYHQDHRLDRVHRTARLVAESAVAYVQAKAPEWRTAPPADAVDLDVTGLLSPNMTGSAALTFESADGGPVCHVRAHVEHHRFAVTERREVVLDRPE